MKKIPLHQQTVTELIWKHPKNVWAQARGKTKIANNPNKQNCTRVSASSAVNDPGPRIWFWLDQQTVKECKTCSFVYESEYGSANTAPNCCAVCVDNLGRVVSFTTCVASSWSNKLGIAEPAWQLEIWYSQSLMTSCSDNTCSGGSCLFWSKPGGPVTALRMIRVYVGISCWGCPCALSVLQGCALLFMIKC